MNKSVKEFVNIYHIIIVVVAITVMTIISVFFLK